MTESNDRPISVDARRERMEPLSHVLGLMKPRTYLVHGFRAGGDWAVRFPPPEGIKFTAVLEGACWVSVEGDPDPYQLTAGDCFLLTSRRSFAFASDPALPTVPAREALTVDANGISHCDTGAVDDCFLVGGHYVFTGDHVGVLFGHLPGVIIVRARSPEASVLRWALDLLARELQTDQPGGALTAEHLAHIMLIQVLRLYLATSNGSGHGWLSALNHPHLSAAIGAMHADISRRWTLHDIARTAGMSRSSFAEAFKRIVGQSPLEYLTGWRMQIASDRLRTTEHGVATIAHEVGYESEAAFSTAFKKIYGRSPRAHRQPDRDARDVRAAAARPRDRAHTALSAERVPEGGLAPGDPV